MVETIAAGLGHTFRGLLMLVRLLPGIAGPVAIVYGLWLFDYRIALVIGGGFLILADLRLAPAATPPPPTPKDVI